MLFFMEDDNIFNKGVGYKESMFILNLAVKWIAERKVVDVAVSMTDSSGNNFIVGVLLVSGTVWANVDVELIYLTPNFAFWQIETVWESIVGFRHIQMEFFVTFESSHYLSVQVSVAGTVSDGSTFIAAPVNDVLARFQFINKFV